MIKWQNYKIKLGRFINFGRKQNIKKKNNRNQIKLKVK